MVSATSRERYQPQQIETRWQRIWEEKGLHRAEDFAAPPKFYCLVEFPYPSGAGLHVGHVRAWAAMDAYVRWKRMQGLNVLYPMGWDAFGLPAENYALKTGVHPSRTVAENVARFKRQCQSLGLSFDWSREINTTDSSYYRWTQWIFLKLLEKSLAYRAAAPVNWCPSCKTTLADEEVLADGMHERCGQPTQKKRQKQWLLRITSYAERLLKDLDLVDYSQKIRVQQENWIGKKEGINITYVIPNPPVAGEESLAHASDTATRAEILRPANGGAQDDRIIDSVTCFTTRPDTMFGATFIVLAPEHQVVASLLKSKIKSQKSKIEEIESYVARAKSKPELERIAEGREKTGVFTGLYALNPLTNRRMPVWVSDFVLSHVGTGAVVGVPGHDRRDFEFAQQFGLEIVRVVVGKSNDRSPINRREQVQEEEGTMMNSGFLDGLDIRQAIEKMMIYLEEKGWGKRTVTYHLRDWVFSRQHYWGEPIPVVYCARCVRSSSGRSHLPKVRPSKDPQRTTVENGVEYAIVPVPEDQLPIELPYVEKYEPSGTGESPLATMTDWVNTTCPVCGGSAKRETDTMPNWAGSNWYYLAYLFANKLGNQNSSSRRHSGLDPESRRLDAGSTPGMTDGLGHSDFLDVFTANKDVINFWMPVDLYEGGFEHTTLHLLYSRFIYKFLYDLGVVPGPEPYAARRSHGIVLGADGRKMSKSFGNVVNPEEIVAEYGADALRLYEMFMGPFDQAVSWNAASLAGCWRFLGRVFRLCHERVGRESAPLTLRQQLQKTVKKVGEDLDALKFNTAVAALMELVKAWEEGQLGRADAGTFLKLLAPFAPHLAEELWLRLRDQPNQRKSATSWSIHQQPWPTYDKRLLQEEKVTVVVQVNGKLRERLRVNSGTGEAEVRALAEESPRLAKYLRGRVKRTVFVPGKLLNFVI